MWLVEVLLPLAARGIVSFRLRALRPRIGIAQDVALIGRIQIRQSDAMEQLFADLLPVRLCSRDVEPSGTAESVNPRQRPLAHRKMRPQAESDDAVRRSFVRREL
jgi:hypothetical protein